MLHFLGLIIIGALIGWVASKIMHGRGGLFRNIIVGIGSGNVWSIGGFFIAVGGACILILLSRLITGKQ